LAKKKREEKMQNLKLQMQITVDGFVAGPDGKLDWMKPEIEMKDDKLLRYISSMVDSSDTILMGRKMTDDFVKYWTGVLDDPESSEYAFAKKMVDTPKVVFTKTLEESPWPNTTLAKGDIVREVNKLKKRDGRGLLVYGGAGFVASLIDHNLIDEYHLFVNPVAIGTGMPIFGDVKDKFELKPIGATPFECGVTVQRYLPAGAAAWAASTKSS
jgi:dihydrofolate reductase